MPWNRPFFRIFLLLFGLLMTLLSAACNQPQQGPLNAGQVQSMLSELVDVSLPDGQRQAVDARLAENIGADSPKRLAALVEIVEGYGQHPAMKIYALQQIRRANSELAEAVLARNIPQFNDWDVLIYACNMAVELQDKDLIGPLVQSLSRPAVTYSLPRRPEVHAIERLSGRNLSSELAFLLLSPGDEQTRLDALQELYDLEGRERLEQLILAAPSTDPLISDLQWYAGTFHFVPRDKTEVLWIQRLHEPSMATLVDAAQRHAAWIRAQYIPDGIEPRLVALLAFLGHRIDYPSRGVVVEQVAELLAQQQHVRRMPSYPGAPDDIDPTLKTNQNRLSYLDLLLVRTLSEALSLSENRRQIYDLGFSSMSDRDSETGGLLAFDASSTADSPLLSLKEYPSELNINAGVYVSGEQLILDTPRGIAQFVFHFQSMDNSQYVGPAAGDVQYVKNTRCNVVIFTSTGDHIFDAMVDFPSEAVIDLGVYRAPD